MVSTQDFSSTCQADFSLLRCCVRIWKPRGWAEEGAVLSSIPGNTKHERFKQGLEVAFFITACLFAYAEVWKSGTEVWCWALPIASLKLGLQEKAKSWLGLCGVPEQCLSGRESLQAWCEERLLCNEIAPKRGIGLRHLAKSEPFAEERLFKITYERGEIVVAKS